MRRMSAPAHALLAIDIGNTRLKWTLYDRAAPGARALAGGAEFLDHIERLGEGEWAGLPVRPAAMIGCVVAGDHVRRRAEEQIDEAFDLPASWVVSSTEEAGLVNGYDHPTRLGADRWVAMIGARHRMLGAQRAAGAGPRPMVVVMVGTAVTVEAVDAEGRFLGGLILPGHGIMLRHLRHRRRGRAHGAAPAPPLRRRAGVLHDRRRRLEDGACHGHALRAGGVADHGRAAGHRRAARRPSRMKRCCRYRPQAVPPSTTSVEPTT